MTWNDFRLPDSPPALQLTMPISEQQRARAEEIIARLSEALDYLPVVLSQQGKVICASGFASENAAAQLARAIERVWNDGKDHVAREVIRFEEEIIEETEGRTNFKLYSLHIDGAVTLTVGWDLSVSLTLLRAEIADAKEVIRRILA
jgi:hypothetical protein